jgi:hypothetical protein
LPKVLVPTVLSPRGVYRVTLLKFPEKGEAGEVHIELQDGLATETVELPETLMNWIRTAGSGLILEGATDGVELSPSGNSIQLSANDERRFPLKLKMISGGQQVSVRIVKKP